MYSVLMAIMEETKTGHPPSWALAWVCANGTQQGQVPGLQTPGAGAWQLQAIRAEGGGLSSPSLLEGLLTLPRAFPLWASVSS